MQDATLGGAEHGDAVGPEVTVELPDGGRRRFIVCGDTPLAYRLVEELVHQYEAHVTAIFPPTRTIWTERISDTPGVTVVESDRLDQDTFTRAELERAHAIALVDQEDAGNVNAALLAQELNPDLRIVIRMFNRSLGDRMSKLLNNVAVLSAAAIAAPAFVAAALDETTTAPVTVADRTLVATRREGTRPEDIILGIAITENRDEPETLPPAVDEPRTDIVLARSKPAPPPRPRRRQSRIRLVPILVGARLRLILGLLVALFVIGTAILAWVKDISWDQAAYLAVLTELGSADADPRATGVERITLVVLTLVSIALIPALTAAVVDAAVKARLRLESGALTEPISDHIVVVGLGDVGTRIVRTLNEAGIDVVAIEKDLHARGVQVARDLRIPVIIGDASRNETLLAASVSTSRALVVASTDDVTNLETALLGRAAKPDLKVVLRLFDGEFADRVQRAFSINTSRSVSYLAAPAFAAAMLGRHVIATIPIRRRVLLVAELPLGANSPLEHQSVSTVNRDHEVRLLAIRTGDGTPGAVAGVRGPAAAPHRPPRRRRQPSRPEPSACRHERGRGRRRRDPVPAAAAMGDAPFAPRLRRNRPRRRRTSTVWAGRRGLDTTGMMMPVEPNDQASTGVAERVPVASFDSTGTIRIGRDADNDIVLPDFWVSNKHAEIRRSRDRAPPRRPEQQQRPAPQRPSSAQGGPRGRGSVHDRPARVPLRWHAPLPARRPGADVDHRGRHHGRDQGCRAAR